MRSPRSSAPSSSRRRSDTAAIAQTTATAPEIAIESSTGVAVALPVAGPGARAFAFAIDWHIRAVLALAWYLIAAMAYNHGIDFSPTVDMGEGWFGWVLLPALAIYLLYHGILELAMRGRTPGKRIAGVRIVTRAGSAPGFGAHLIRNVFRTIDAFPVFYGLGLIMTMITRHHVRIGDLAAGTVLIYERADIHAPMLLKRAAQWQPAADRARRLAGLRGRAESVPDAVAAIEDYRLLAHDVARARQGQEGALREFLETAYAQAHATLNRMGTHPGYALLGFFRDQVPEAVHALRKHILWVTLLFLLTALAGAWLVHTYPDLIGLFASPELIATVERGQLWTQGLLNVVPSSVLSLQILSNNIVVSLFAYCAGFLFGLGTIYIVGLNGLMLGAIFVFTGQHGLADDLFRFVVAHGCVEISVMCLSGAAGAAIGEALIRPQTGDRAESFQRAAAISGKLLAACVVLLIGCGFIEGYISPDPAFPLAIRIAVGVGYWLFMIALLRGWVFGRSRHGKRVAT